MGQREVFEKMIRNQDVEGLRRELPRLQEVMDEVDENGVALVFVAARVGDLETLKYLVEYGLRVDVSLRDPQGRSLLHHAALSGNVEKCRYLVERCGMDPLKGDGEMVTSFDIAHREGRRELEDYFASVVGAPWEETYHNPIRTGFFPDPSIIRVGEDYYMVNSTFVFFPCIPISHSRDLIHWQVIGHAIEKPEWAHLEGLEGGRGWWAPDISYSNGWYYIAVTLRMNDDGPVRYKQMVVTSEHPGGPYSEPVLFDEDGIDPSLFHDDDGRHYMLLNRGARIFEINAAATERLSETTLLFYGVNRHASEGPHLLKKDGWYYLFQAEGGTGMGHMETVSRSKTLHGIYTPSPYHPLLRQTDGAALLQRCGHGKPFSTPDGRWFMVYLCGRPVDGKWTVIGRETALDPMTWTPDGWPLLNQGKGPSDQNICPLPACPVEEGTDWITPRSPEAGEITLEGDRVILRGSEHDLHDILCRSVLLRRQSHFRFTFSAELTVPSEGEAGVICYYDENSFLTVSIRKTGDEWYLLAREQEGTEAREPLVKKTSLHPGEKIHLQTQADGLGRTLIWTLPDGKTESLALENVTYLSDEGVRMGKRFTGATVGVYALRSPKVTFGNLNYTPSGDCP